MKSLRFKITLAVEGKTKFVVFVRKEFDDSIEEFDIGKDISNFMADSLQSLGDEIGSRKTVSIIDEDNTCHLYHIGQKQAYLSMTVDGDELSSE